MTGVSVALDVGGTTIKGGVMSGGGGLLVGRRWPTPREHGPDAVVGAVVAAAEEMVELAVATAGTRPDAIGIACLGLVDSRAGVAILSANVGWSHVPLAAIVADRVGLPVALVHDIAAAAIAEARERPAEATAGMLFVAIGTGIGGTPVVGGKPVPGAHHRPGEIGHIPVTGGTEACGCGRRGCLETVASGAALARAYRERTGAPESVSAAEIAGLAERGDADAFAVWHRGCDALAEALTLYSILMDPRLIVLGGGVSLAGERLLDPVRRGIADRLHLPGTPAVAAAKLGDQAALLGAAISARELGAGR
jgi:glucokinase